MTTKLTPEVEIKGLKAYEQVCAFERLRSWRLPLTYVVFPLLAVLMGEALWMRGSPTLARLDFCAAFVLGVVEWFHWKRLNLLYARNLQTLAELESVYGDQLPWIKVENHFAALDQLKLELEEERRRATE